MSDLIAALHDRAIGALIFVFAFPNTLPMPPGVSSILGAPLLFLTDMALHSLLEPRPLTKATKAVECRGQLRLPDTRQRILQ